jgi:hypothetical protein
VESSCEFGIEPSGSGNYRVSKQLGISRVAPWSYLISIIIVIIIIIIIFITFRRKFHISKI